MSTLGVGVRVWVGWCPDGRCDPFSRGARCQIGRIVDGPFPPGGYMTGFGINITENHWMVAIGDEEYHAAESMLFPIDDGDPAAEPREQEQDQPEEVEA